MTRIETFPVCMRRTDCPNVVPEAWRMVAQPERGVSRAVGALFRRLFLTRLLELHKAGKLVSSASWQVSVTGVSSCATLRRSEGSVGVVYGKAPFAGPEAVLSYLSRYTHRVAISNSRLIAFDQTSVTSGYKNYRCSRADREQVMTIAADEFIRRFLLHTLP